MIEIQNKSTTIKLINRVVFYIIGLFFIALGVAFSVNSQLGVSPVNSLPYVISVIIGKDLGTVVIVVFCFYILVQILLLRKEFQWINLTQIVFSTIFGYFVDFAKYILGDFTIPTYLGKLTMLAISILLVALGICIYVNVKLVNMPMEGMTAAIQKKVFKNKTFSDVKVIMDCLVVAVGILLSFTFLGKLVGIREGTVLCAILVGKVMKILQKWIMPILEKLCF